jgi:hypothetical protein
MAEVIGCGGQIMTSRRNEESYRRTFIYTILTGVLGAVLLIMSHIVKVTDYAFTSEVLRDFGMALLPIFVVGIVYELYLRGQFDGRLNAIIGGLAANPNFTQIVFKDQRLEKMREIINGAQESLVIVGSSPLFEFNESPEFLIEKFAKLKSVIIAYLPPQSHYLQSRVVQSGGVNIVQELRVHQRLINQLRAALRGTNVEFIAYDLPPAEFFYICDDRMLLFTWYPFGRSGEQSPCVFVDNLQKNEESRHFLECFTPSLNFIREKHETGHGPEDSIIEIPPKRKLNAWISNSQPKVCEVFRVSINIGVANDTAAASVGFPESDWSEAESLDLVVSVSCLDCTVEPIWQELRMPRTGDSEKIDFLITSRRAGDHEFTVRVYLAKQMIQLQSLRFTVTVAEARMQPAPAL